jgi:hypothetical protein
MEGAAVTEIATLAEKAAGSGVLFKDSEGRDVSTRELHLLPKNHAPDVPDALVVHSLEGLVGYIETNRDQLKAEECIVQVVTPTIVKIVSKLQPRAKRFVYLEAKTIDLVSEGILGQWLVLEQFIIALQTRFVDAHDRARVLDTVGNVTANAQVKTKDDGVSQEITTRKGLIDFAPVPNPVTLAPYRTFREVEQPASPFILRVQQSGQHAALFEADGAAWKLEAVKRVAAWLEGKTSGFPIIR